MSNSTESSRRVAELRPTRDGKFQAEWQLTDTKLLDAVRLSLPPTQTIPIIFVPGIMGSNLCDLKNQPVWLLNSVKDIPAGLAWDWSRKSAGVRQVVLHPGRTKVYRGGGVPKKEAKNGLAQQDYIRRGWGEVSEASYHKFLLWLDEKMNAERNPADWRDFSASSHTDSFAANNMSRSLPGGLVMEMQGLPKSAERNFKTDPITSDELLKRAKFNFPVYAFGYNWLASNSVAAEDLKSRIEKVIAENNVGAIKCSQVILVTHSMGGLVARACSQLPGILNKIVGIVHGVMPATGAAVAYRRCKVGMRDEDFAAGLVIGSSGREVTAVFAQSPGALQLLPSEEYGPGWLEVRGSGSESILSLPIADPYEEIYLKRDKWWGLIREEWLSPAEGAPIKWEQFSKNIRAAREFHRKISKYYHHNTYVFYGGGAEKGSFSKVVWRVKPGALQASSVAALPISKVLDLHGNDIRTDGSNRLLVGGETVFTTTTRGDASVVLAKETSYWEIGCEHYNSAGDGTVPSQSGSAPRSGGGKSILQQFELEKIKHEPAYRDYPMAQQIVHYSLTKLAAMAELS